MREVSSWRKLQNFWDLTEYKLKNAKEYHILDEYMDGYFDFILIDGTERDKCAKSALAKIREGGYIYLDNTDKVDDCSGDIRIAEENPPECCKGERRTGQILCGSYPHLCRRDAGHACQSLE